MTAPRLAVFDLDHTLLSGDSDVLWCEFLLARGELDRASFEARNAEIEHAYRAGAISAQAFTEFYLSTLAGRARSSLLGLRDAFMREAIVPRIPQAARALVESHRAGGDLLVLSTATNRFLVERTAPELGFEHLIATEPELESGVFTGRTEGVLNMREGKPVRLRDWLAVQGHPPRLLAEATAYSDSINDLSLLQAVARPVVVDPDARLLAHAQASGWQVLRLQR
ncbi:MAG TPA: HAD-IB family hydrolase [Burkholderiaceae bacterium]|nr:HAD-IB family hydrolase [Burkholderiaceae bacterium]